METEKIILRNHFFLETLKPFFLILILIILVVRLFSFINNFSVDVPFSDQWILFPEIWKGKGPIELFYLQNGPHRLGLAFVIDSIILKLTNWNTIALAITSGIYLTIAAIIAMLLKRRMFGYVGYSDFVIPAIVLTLSQYETIVIEPFSAYGIFPMMLLFMLAYTWCLKTSLFRNLVMIILSILITFSGFGFFAIPSMFFIVFSEIHKSGGLDIMYSRKSKLFIFLLISLLATVGVFFINYKFNPASGCHIFPESEPTKYISGVSLMFAGLFGF